MITIGSILHPDFFYVPDKKLKKLFYAGISRRIAISFIGFFSVVYVFQIYADLGYGFRGAVYMVLLFYLLLILAKQVALSFSENLSQRIGFDGILRLSILPFLLLIIFMVLGKSHPLLLMLGGISWGVHTGMFWWGYHGYFMKVGDKNRYGAGIGEAEMLKTIVTVTSPITGAFLINLFGFSAIYIISALFMVAAIFLIDREESIRQEHDVSFMDVVRLIFKHKSSSLMYMATGAEGAFYTVGWSLFLYLFYGDVLGLGGVMSLSLLLSAIYGAFVGNRIDKKGEGKIIALGSPLMSLSWLIRYISSGTIMFVVSDSLRHFGFMMVNLPLTELSYKKGVDDYTAKSILFREIALGIGGIFLIIAFFIIVSISGVFSWAFILIAFISLIPLVSVFRTKL